MNIHNFKIRNEELLMQTFSGLSISHRRLYTNSFIMFIINLQNLKLVIINIGLVSLPVSICAISAPSNKTISIQCCHLIQKNTAYVVYIGRFNYLVSSLYICNTNNLRFVNCGAGRLSSLFHSIMGHCYRIQYLY